MIFWLCMTSLELFLLRLDLLSQKVILFFQPHFFLLVLQQHFGDLTLNQLDESSRVFLDLLMGK